MSTEKDRDIGKSALQKARDQTKRLEEEEEVVRHFDFEVSDDEDNSE